MVCKDTLRIKHLPKELSDAQKEDFIRHFGASKVKVITSKAKSKSIVYAKFDSDEMAKSVLYRLHQITILNCRLSVEFADSDLLRGHLNTQKVNQNSDDNRFFKNFVNSMNSFNDSVGFHQPPPPHLKYCYPKASRATINNIAHALATVPRFYTQVLHLMNKMNLPPPFAMPDPPVNRAPPVVLQAQKRKISSSESELESEPDEKKLKEIIPEKLKTKQVKKVKLVKPPLVAKSTNKSTQNVEQVFDKVEVMPLKKIEMKPIEKIEETPAPIIIVEESKESEDELFPCISLEELRANQETNLDSLSVFKNYTPGAPTNKLYIKNCAKTVVVQDLEYIFNRYRDNKSNDFNIRLMQEGRMKGQAFVTLDSVEQAERAVNETNGFKLKDKPLVVVFAKAAKKT